jgi:hypothetical protein
MIAMVLARLLATSIFSFVLALLFVLPAHADTHIATFTDDRCQDSAEDLVGPNGYPNGTCQALGKAGPYKSFQVVGLDPGCQGTLRHIVRDARAFTDDCSHYLRKRQR